MPPFVHLTLLLLATLLQPAPQSNTPAVTSQRPSPRSHTPELREPFVRTSSITTVALAATPGEGDELRDPFDGATAGPRGSGATASSSLRSGALDRSATVGAPASLAPRAVEAAPARRVAPVEPAADAPADLRDPFRRAGVGRGAGARGVP
ncbi:MAG: hypothetical protein K1X88_17480 [Nannocystaceae bacterium]|nr:hypothetical protein [Nannocystaceae bacterium]